jgi:TonB family protein
MSHRCVLLILLYAGQYAAAQELPISRRLLVLTQKFLDSAEQREAPEPVVGDRSRVLVLFRLAENGRVLDVRATGSSEQARNASLTAVKKWRFKPTLVAGRPVQMQSGALFEFSPAAVRIQAPQPMSADQISPVLSTRCPLAIMKGDPDSASICRKEARAVEMNRAHTAMESLSAHDEFGVALVQFEHDARQALAEFSRAIDLAPEGLNESDAEWAELHWHRGIAEQQLQQNTEAYNDFTAAERGFAIAATSTPGYQDLSAQVVRQHASMLEKDGKREEAEALLKTLSQR